MDEVGEARIVEAGLKALVNKDGGEQPVPVSR